MRLSDSVLQIAGERDVALRLSSAVARASGANGGYDVIAGRPVTGALRPAASPVRHVAARPPL